MKQCSLVIALLLSASLACAQDLADGPAVFDKNEGIRAGLGRGSFKKAAPKILPRPEGLAQDVPAAIKAPLVKAMPVMKPDGSMKHHLLVKAPDTTMLLQLRLKRP